jgi:hypothetical protein
MQWETVAIPFQAGISPNTRDRLLPPSKLLRAENCFYFNTGGPEKRYGHKVKKVVTSTTPKALNGVVPPGSYLPRANYATSDPGFAPSWLYGWGLMDAPQVGADPNNVWAVSEHHEAGHLFGQAARDSEILPWDGHRLYSYAPQQAQLWGETYLPPNRGPACMPALRASPIAKEATTQTYPDACDNGMVRTVAWVAPGNKVHYSVFDSKTGACIVAASEFSMTTPKSVRVLSCGVWTHILIADQGATQVIMKSFTQNDPTTVTSRNMGTIDAAFFDVWKVTDTALGGFWVLATLNVNVVTIKVLKGDGSTLASFTPDLGGHAAAGPIGVAVNNNKTIGLIWSTAGREIYFRGYSYGGLKLTDVVQVNNGAGESPVRATIAPEWMQKLDGGGSGVPFSVWDIYIEEKPGTTPYVYSYQVTENGSTVTKVATRYGMTIATHAFRVGNRTFTWLGYPSSLQACWYLCDARLLPVGKMDYGVANIDTSSLGTVQSVNWHVDSTTFPDKDIIVFHGALGYNLRVATATNSPTPNGVFAESSIKFYELDFLPRLQWAQAGRCTYFAGAQLWAYDGVELNEATPHMAPEVPTFTAGGGGVLSSAGNYFYRVDLCHKNSQNEEVRTWSIISGLQTPGGANTKFTLSIRSVPMTRREDAYFLVYRTENNGTNFYLLSSRDPTNAKFVKNDQTAATVSFVDDTITDAALIAKEYHPANAGGNYIDPLPAPACELVAAGRDRLWLCGGELSQGEIAPSRLFSPGVTPTFSPGLNIQVDRNAEPITAIGFVGEITAVFRRTSTYVLDSDGPDNNFVGGWANPRLAIADVGAISPESLALSAPGLFFLSESGIRLIGSSGGLIDDIGKNSDNIGKDVQNLAIGMDIAGAVVNSTPTQIRWYSRRSDEPALVLDYSSGSWTTWTGLECVGARYWAPGGVAILSRSDGYLWVETPGSYLDGDRMYEMVIKTAWLTNGQLGDFQRVKRFALFGLAPGEHTHRIRVFYNEEPFHQEEISFVVPGVDVELQGMSQFNTAFWGSDTNGSTWGANTWGDSAAFTYGTDRADFGVSNPASNLWFRDGVFRYRKRPQRQKCSVISFEFSDCGAATQGFIPVALGLELGKKTGLDRIPGANN